MINAILVVTADEHYINQRGNNTCKWKHGWAYSDKVMTVEEIQGRKSCRKRRRKSEETEEGGWIVGAGSAGYCGTCGTDLIRLGPAVMKERVQAVPLLG